jgi:DNA-binding CsgD family transcriptional regulator
VELTENLTRDDPVATPVLPLVRLAGPRGFDPSTLELLLRLAAQSPGVALLVLPGAADGIGQDSWHEGGTWLRLGCAALDRHRYAEAEQAFRSGLAACEDRGLDGWVPRLRARLAESLLEQARYAEVDTALEGVRRGALTPAVREAVGYVSGRAAAQRTGDPGELLDEAWALAQRSGDEARMVRVACARAEAAWIAGRAEDLRAEAHRGWRLAIERSDAWALGELSWWLTRAGSPPAGPTPLSEPFRSMLDGDWRAAADAWLRRGRVLWAAFALSCSPSPADARQALALADDVGAVAARKAMVRERRAAGLGVPPRPRSTTRANPLQLTDRELEVLGLLTEGLTNRQIARRLYLSDRKVAHHVSAVLHKLGQPTRSAAVATAARLGILRPATPPAERRTAPPAPSSAGHFAADGRCDTGAAGCTVLPFPPPAGRPPRSPRPS